MERYRLFAAYALFWMAAVGIGVVRGGFVPWFLAGSLGVLLLYALLMPALCLKGACGGMRVSAERIVAGEDVQVKLNLRLAGWLPVPWLRVTGVWKDAAGNPKYRSSRLLYPGKRRSVGCRYVIRDTERGLYRHEGIELSTGDLFGLLIVTKRLPLDAELAVLPIPLSPPRMSDWKGSGGAAGDSRPGVIGSEPSQSIRDHQSGDPLRSIHWLATARTGSLKTVDSETRQPDRVFVLLADRNRELFETEIEAAAGLLVQAAAQGAQLGFACVGESGEASAARGCATASGYRRNGLEELLLILAALAKPAEDAARHEAPEAFICKQANELPAACSVYVISANPDDRLAAGCERLAARSRRVVFVHVQKADRDAEAPNRDDSRPEARFVSSGCSYCTVYDSGAKGGALHGTIA
ncbi:DUF58 domain-containing protein [Gorillibacterium timonense]|uniref:DUF58 domain-containing protein n=1 Tax=Gorillibacterium timonense TaxID=1689269 RepID=UPI00071C8EE7|nr:DUF58 domain-containing protein [Gorillibacterium timonense]